MQTELIGPDLKGGIAASDLPDGETLVGHADGETVLLVRRGKEVFALGATCTHYGGPLGEGLVVGNTVRCPWHHACFDLRTGEPLRAPALNPVAVWEVQVGSRIVVTGKRGVGAGALAGTVPAGGPAPTRIAIVGAGGAGNAAAEMLRRRGFQGSITMIGAEESVPVDRPNLSKEYLAGKAPEEWIPLRPREFYEEQRIELLTGRRITKLAAVTKTLTFDNGSTRDFDAMLLATGADPIRLPIAGSDQPHVHYLRTWADSRAIIAEAKEGRRAVIVGAGFIGLEVAASLRERKVEVSVVAPEDIPLARIMGDSVGRFVQRLHESHGVRFFLGSGVKTIGRDSVTVSDGRSLPADFVVIGAGVRPNAQLAEAAGLRVDNGIVVNEFLETSAQGIFAAGDVARFPDRFTGKSIRVEHWVVAERQGQAAACNMIGPRQPYTIPPFFWSAHYDVIINYVGNATGWDQVDVRGSLDDRHALIAYRSAGSVVAIATIFMDVESLQAEVAMEAGDADAVEQIVSSV
jgi:NADPH-dependent 2,4-dienoyl-CoA reductase/sulfur reductase-like enzyme/nitrite reductase/ring-hydroxylating ferredoxin subunit